MSERGLLERAAKAAFGEAWAWVGDEIHVGASPTPWNPLTDDGDALRLAVKLGMIVDMSGLNACEVRYYVGNEQFSRRIAELNDYRRAIVRAAAAMVDK